MTNNLSWFITLDNSIKIPINMGNGTIVQSGGKRTISIKTKKERRLINNVCMFQN